MLTKCTNVVNEDVTYDKILDNCPSPSPTPYLVLFIVFLFISVIIGRVFVNYYRRRGYNKKLDYINVNDSSTVELIININGAKTSRY